MKLKIIYPELMAQMARLGVNQTKLAKVLGIGKSAMHHKIYGLRQFKAEEMIKISEYLNKSIDELFR